MAPSADRRETRAPLLTARQVRDLLASVLIVAGVGGVLTVLFIAAPLAGYGAIAALGAALGVYLGTDR